MSLYDKYHSDININYMYDLLCKILKEEIGEDITNNIDLKNIFTQNSKQIFNEVNTDDITVINKILLDKHINEFAKMIQVKKQSSLSVINENESLDNKYNELIQSRNIPLNDNDIQVLIILYDQNVLDNLYYLDYMFHIFFPFRLNPCEYQINL